MIQGLDFWYDAQMRRFLEQIVRAFSGFHYRTGRRDGQEPQLKMVPCRMASTDRMVAAILRNQSENVLLSVPMITVAMTGIAGRREAVQNLNHVDTRQVIERDIDPDTGLYTSARGRSYTVYRMMPRPFEMTVQVDMWTSNQEQKFQLAEQILTVFYPDIAIKNSENAIDWTALTTMTLDDISWSSRSIPVGTENEIDIMTLTFRLPFWLNPPASVVQQTVIEQIVTNIYQGSSVDETIAENLIKRDIVTPNNHVISVSNGKIKLLGGKAAERDADGNVYSWKTLFDVYGLLRPTLTQIRLKTTSDSEDESTDIIGTVQYDEARPNELFWQIDPDTLPGNTLPPIDAVIDPIRSFPLDGGDLPAAATGQRYLLLNDIGPSQAWGVITARANDIIEYRGGAWQVSFAANGNPQMHHVLNLYTGRQLRWTGQDWVLTIDGQYAPGYWRLAL